jgi:hypothetical protein
LEISSTGSLGLETGGVLAGGQEGWRSLNISYLDGNKNKVVNSETSELGPALGPLATFIASSLSFLPTINLLNKIKIKKNKKNMSKRRRDIFSFPPSRPFKVR